MKVKIPSLEEYWLTLIKPRVEPILCFDYGEFLNTLSFFDILFSSSELNPEDLSFKDVFIVK